MKIRDSGMPEESMWSDFFDVPFILGQMEVKSDLHIVADLGCGFGTFSIPAAKIVGGEVLAFDIDEEMIRQMQAKIDQQEIQNIKLYLGDFIDEGTGLSANSVDYVMIFNILHHNNPMQILNEVYRILKKKAMAGIIHWRSDVDTPRGPSLEIRPRPEECANLAEEAGFQLFKRPFIIEPYHYGFVIQKP